MKFQWERIDCQLWTMRAKVYGGWIIRTCEVDDANTYVTSESMVFIPDAEHKWKL